MRRARRQESWSRSEQKIDWPEAVSHETAADSAQTRPGEMPSDPEDDDWVDPRPLPGWLRRLPVVPVVVTVASMFLVEYLLIGSDPDGYCLYPGVALLFWTISASLVAGLACGVYLAVIGAPLAGYFLLVAAVAATAGLGYGDGLNRSGCATFSDDGVPAVVIGFAAASIGALPAALAGRNRRKRQNQT